MDADFEPIKQPVSIFQHSESIKRNKLSIANSIAPIKTLEIKLSVTFKAKKVFL